LQIGMRAVRLARQVVVPRRGNLVSVTFQEDNKWLSALIPDDAVVGLCREILLVGMYDLGSGRRDLRLIIDAGAHVGLYSLIASRRARRVVSLEADPVNFQILKLNVLRNGLDNVTTLNAALATTSGETMFARSDFSEGGALSDDGDVLVTCMSLDDLITRHGQIDCLKIDIEGAEFGVLETSEKLREVQAIVGELHYTDGEQKRLLIDRLTRAGFRVALTSEAELRHPRQLLAVLRNWRRIRGHNGLKLAALAYLGVAGHFGASRNATREMPLFVATRSEA
jgi:FkbM family methyltransferase